MLMQERIKILVIGSGGREHAIVKECLKSPLTSEVIVAPGNGGMSQDARCLPVDVSDPSAIAKLAKNEAVDFAIIGPEVPLCAGAVNQLEAEDITTFGPNKKAARFEGSKTYTKDFLAKYKIPTARYGNFSEVKPALEYLGTYPEIGRIVVKASGLAAGKGVLIAENRAEAGQFVRDILENRQFGKSGDEIVIEEFMEGRETSLHLLVSGKQFAVLPTSRDHKKIGEGETGPNTGGMGVIAPDPTIPTRILEEIIENIAKPTLSAFQSEEIDYRGILYIGLILTTEGPKVLEFNVRLGDPETQLILPLFEEDTVEVFLAAARGNSLSKYLTPTGQSAITVVLAANGYPDQYETGVPITLDVNLPEGVDVIHAGTKLDSNGILETSGGRVLNIVAKADNAAKAFDKVYSACNHRYFDGQYFRKDIGKPVPTP
ncbi:MAG: phosphoribosylamine--glycine ligase [Opitutae bacterium]|nr:phosphoribosylamine--glycine ligase [Opitutae bacterium]MBT5379029.1 phosphoribosylamine--glycine ligase [Opitutae bacterium]MBT5690821.1 phosphoribosylamine--glycine ligase [Opitutae bacterium]MBT6956799.1 phosphoribosylamine--glycine ligase [Opitutae bacterium]MBT7854362.1 phosphoribosylamine--glycine ligase [Opitutae bacterium]